MFFKKIAGFCGKLGLGKSQKLENLYEEMLSKIGMGIRSEFVKIGEQKLFLDKEDSLMLSIKNNDHEVLETEYLKYIIQEGDTVIDLGANIGYYTLIFAKLVGESGHVFAFEPEPSNFELLSKNIKENKHENVTLVQKATSNKNSKIKLYVSKRNLASHRIFDAGDKRKSIEIDVITLNEYFKKNTNPIKIIKMDVEGAEGATLLGASKIIENSNFLEIKNGDNKLLKISLSEITSDLDPSQIGNLAAHIITDFKNNKIPSRIKFGLDVGINGLDSKLPCNICFNTRMGNPFLENKPGSFHWSPMFHERNTIISLGNFSTLKNYKQVANLELNFYRIEDSSSLTQNISLQPNSEKRISIKDFKLNEFLKTEGWVTIKANNPYVTGYYFNMNSSGSVSGDHFF